MKKVITIISSIGLVTCVAILTTIGCQSAATIATRTDAAVIPTVNAAMTAWSAYVASGKASAQQITTISNSYNVYYNSQLTLSNLLVLYTTNPTTNLQASITLTETAIGASATNIVNIINTLTK